MVHTYDNKSSLFQKVKGNKNPTPVKPMTMINTNEYDHAGRCVRHPHIQLRKRKVFASGIGILKWKVLLARCPQCVLDSMVEEDHANSTQTSKKKSQQCSSKHHHKRGHHKSKKCEVGGRFHRSESTGENTHTTAASSDVVSEPASPRTNSKQRSSRHAVKGMAASDDGVCSPEVDAQQENDESNCEDQHITAALSDTSSVSAVFPRRTYTKQRISRNAVTSMIASDDDICSNEVDTQGEKNRDVVCSMSFQDDTSRKECSYTGQIELSSKLPDGMGTCVFQDGRHADGQWHLGGLIVKKGQQRGKSNQATNIRLRRVVPPSGNTAPDAPARSDSLEDSIGSNSKKPVKASAESNLERLPDLDNSTGSFSSALERLADLDNSTSSLRSSLQTNATTSLTSGSTAASPSCILPLPAALRRLVVEQGKSNASSQWVQSLSKGYVPTRSTTQRRKNDESSKINPNRNSARQEKTEETSNQKKVYGGRRVSDLLEVSNRSNSRSESSQAKVSKLGEHKNTSRKVSRVKKQSQARPAPLPSYEEGDEFSTSVYAAQCSRGVLRATNQEVGHRVKSSASVGGIPAKMLSAEPRGSRCEI